MYNPKTKHERMYNPKTKHELMVAQENNDTTYEGIFALERVNFWCMTVVTFAACHERFYLSLVTIDFDPPTP